MISSPTTPQILQTIKTELNEKIQPALSDPTHVVAIQMISAMLDSLPGKPDCGMKSAWCRAGDRTTTTASAMRSSSARTFSSSRTCS